MHKYHNLLPAIFNHVAEDIFSSHYSTPVLLPVCSEIDVSPLIQEREQTISLLHPKEREVLNGYKFAKRREEFLTGRICAKLAILNYFKCLNRKQVDIEPQHIQILAEDSGRPIISPQSKLQHPSPEISISHSRGYAIATASITHCGIDIQYSSNTLLRVKEKYCTPIEDQILRQSLPSQREITRMTILWAAKEAVQKSCSHKKMPGFLELELIDIKSKSSVCATYYMHLQGKQDCSFSNTYNVITTLFKDYAIALCIKEEQKNA